jgi:hypothetical protein
MKPELRLNKDGDYEYVFIDGHTFFELRTDSYGYLLKIHVDDINQMLEDAVSYGIWYQQGGGE